MTPDRINIESDPGQISIDFLAGVTFFMVGLIIVLSMVSGILSHLQGKTIDFDAVAYRTGVILTEDPGYWEIGESVQTSPEWYNREGKGTNWENLPNDENFKNKIRRLGLENDKQNPGVLSRIKVNKFFGLDGEFFILPDDYSKRLFFSDFPYNFQVTLTEINGNKYSIPSSAQPPANSGYIRRIVKIKENTVGTYEISGEELENIITTGNLYSTSIIFDTLINQSIGPNFWINPNSNELRFIVNSNTPVYLNKIELLRYDPLASPPIPNNRTDSQFQKNINYSQSSLNYTIVNDGSLLSSEILIDQNNPLTIYLPAGTFNPKTYPDNHIELLNLSFKDCPNKVIYDSISYKNQKFTPSSFHLPQKLTPAVLEVRVW